MPIETVDGTLENERDLYHVHLVLHTVELRGQMPDAIAVAYIELTPANNLGIEDGYYLLRYSFRGRNETAKVRMKDSKLLSPDSER